MLRRQSLSALRMPHLTRLIGDMDDEIKDDQFSSRACSRPKVNCDRPIDERTIPSSDGSDERGSSNSPPAPPSRLQRQESDRRDRLEVVPSSLCEKSSAGFPKANGPSLVPDGQQWPPPTDAMPDEVSEYPPPLVSNHTHYPAKEWPIALSPLRIPELDAELPPSELEYDETEAAQLSLRREFERHWILNLSMHFRDKSNREKFFVTYAETSTLWRRITISLDYRNAPPGSLEADLERMRFQKDKNFRIYEAIRDSLADIDYYDTVTNLKLETDPEDGQLHVHVREDINEVIDYPAASLFQHVSCRRYAEEDLEFVAHLSGFVYRVQAQGRTLIKKELPGPDTVDEFLYEINALDALLGADHVIQLEGLVTDKDGQIVKGLLISHAQQGALVDIVYDLRETEDLLWPRREKWAKQIIQGLSNIHEAGFVQGDFTLSNIVIDDEDNASIIDINRRGCPVGWETPELSRLIDAGQRISMCISTKTDLFQLGMVLWALAREVDDPERMERPLPSLRGLVPDYFCEIVESCLSERPQGRRSARDLLKMFPRQSLRRPRRCLGRSPGASRLSPHSTLLPHRSDKEYIDPKLAITLEDVARGKVTYIDATGDDHYGSDGAESWVMEDGGGHSPYSSRRRRRSSPYARSASSVTSFSAVPRHADEDGFREAKAVDGRSTGARQEPELPVVQANPLKFVHTDSGFDEPNMQS